MASIGRNPAQAKQPVPARRHRRWLAIAFAVVAVAALVWGMRRAPEAVPVVQEEPPSRPGAAARSGQPDPGRLVGSWLRADGGYVIAVEAATADGRLDAAYYNPSPINVARAEWRDAGGGLDVFIELRDVNYPGATYTLRYLPDRDLLVGQYVQPLVGETFEVGFARLQE